MNLSANCESELQEAWPTLVRIGQLAADRGEKIALVGGAVRDLLLHTHPTGDLDLIVEGSAIALAEAWQNLEGGELQRHRPFENAVWTANSLKLELIRARRERYPGVAELPEVQPASLEEDLGRRDFRLNAMAIDLHPSRLGELLDPHGGLADLQSRRLEVFHSRSFSDDPTRLLRAIRYSTRLGLEIGRSCQESLAIAQREGALETLTLQRYGAELHRLFSEPTAAKGIEQAARLGGFERLPLEAFSLLTSAEDCVAAQRAWRGEAVDQAELLWLLLSDQLEHPQKWARLIPEGGPAAKRFASGTGAIRAALAACERSEDSGDHGEALEPLDPVQRAFAAFLSPGNPALHWWEQTGRFIGFAVDGSALIRAGFTPGPAIGSALHRAKRAAWRGASEEEQLLAALTKTRL